MIRIQWIGFITLVRKELIRVFRIWTQTLLPSVMTTTLYFLIFGRFIGSRIGQLHDVSYIQFIVPGLIMMAVITNAYANVSSSVFSAKFQRNIEELLVSPLSSGTILMGYLGGGILRGIIVGVLVTLVSLFFSPLHFVHPILVGATIVLTSFFFSICGFLNATIARKFDDISIIPTFVLTPLTYLGGVFYSVKFLPEFWQKVSLLNPIFYLVNVFRYGFLGISDVPVTAAFGGFFALTVALWFLAYTLLKRGFGMRN
ncbi:MAG: ABC transporter permease [Candidatus Margulisiibacteriota bacterium]